MPRRARTPRQKLEIFQRDHGICHICGLAIDGTREKWELEHKVPYAMTRDDSDENLAPAHVKCHAGKTKTDKAKIAKAKRIEAKHNGARKTGKRRMPYRRFDGTVVWPD